MDKLYEVTQSIEIEADPQTAYEVICDYEAYPSWHKHVRKVQVQGRDENGAPNKVHFIFDIAIKKGFQIVLKYDNDDANYHMRCWAVAGDFKEADADYQFRELLTGKTLCTLLVKVNIGMVLPAKITNFLIDKVMFGLLKMIKKEAERRYKCNSSP